MKKIISFIFVLIMCFSCFTLTVFAEGEELPPVEDVVEETYTITFETGNDIVVESITYTKLVEKLILPKINKDGYNFLGWFDGSFIIEEIKPGEEKNLNLVAKWGKFNYFINFLDSKYSDVNALPSIKYNIDSDTIDLTTEEFKLEKEGYNFLGWYNYNNEKIEKIEKGSFGTISLFPKWEEIVVPAVEYTITLDVNGGNALQQTTITGEAVSAVILPTPEKEGFNFLGWYNGETKFEETVMPEADITLVAKWEEIETKEETEYTVTYEDEIWKFYVCEDKCRVVIGEEEHVVNCEIKDNILYLYVEGEVFPAQINSDNTLTPITKEELLPCKVKVLKSEFGDVETEINAGNIGDIVTFKIKPYILYKVTSVKVNDVDLLPNEDGFYSFSLVNGDNNISVEYQVDNEQLEIIAINLANAKKGNWEDIFSMDNLYKLIDWIITIFFSCGFLTVLLKTKKVQAKTTDEVVGISKQAVEDKLTELINNFLENKFAPIITKIDSKLVGTEEVCKTLARCFILSQENTPEARLAIISELATVQKTENDLSKQVKAVIFEEMKKIQEIQKKKEDTIKELEEKNESINPEVKDNGRI